MNIGGELLRTGTGATAINANMTVVWRQIYRGAVTLDSATLSSPQSDGAIEIDGALTLTHDATVNASTVLLQGAVDGAHNLVVDATSVAIFSGAVGGMTPLASLTVGNGTTALGGNVTTTGTQSYGGAVALLGNIALATSNAAVSFEATVDTAASASAPANLSVASGIGVQTYGGALGAGRALGGLVIVSGNAAGISLADATNDFSSVTVTTGGAVTIADSGALTVTSINAGGDILVSTQSGNLTVTGAIATTSTTATALKLEAGRSASRVASAGAADTNGNVIISGGNLSVGAGGLGTIYTGSIAGSTGLSGAVTAGNFRYWSDTNGHTGYTTALTGGIGAVYREQPVVTVTATAPGSGRAYDGTTTAPVFATTGQVNGDTGSGTGTLAITMGGNAATLLNAGSYTLGLTGASAGTDLGGLGYAAQAGSNSGYLITPVTLSITGVVAADKSYDGTRAASLSSAGTLTGLVGSETLTLTAAEANFADADAGQGKTVTATGYAIANGTGLASNYVLSGDTATATATITPATLTASLIGTVAKTYDGTASAVLNASNYQLTGTIFGSDSVALNDPTSGSFADANAGVTKNVSVSGLTLGNGNYVLASTTPRPRSARSPRRRSPPA